MCVFVLLKYKKSQRLYNAVALTLRILHIYCCYRHYIWHWRWRLRSEMSDFSSIVCIRDAVCLMVLGIFFLCSSSSRHHKLLLHAVSAFSAGKLVQEINNKQRLLAKSTEIWRLGIFIWVCVYVDVICLLCPIFSIQYVSNCIETRIYYEFVKEGADKSRHIANRSI